MHKFPVYQVRHGNEYRYRGPIFRDAVTAAKEASTQNENRIYYLEAATHYYDPDNEPKVLHTYMNGEESAEGVVFGKNKAERFFIQETSGESTFDNPPMPKVIPLDAIDVEIILKHPLAFTEGMIEEAVIVWRWWAKGWCRYCGDKLDERELAADRVDCCYGCW